MVKKKKQKTSSYLFKMNLRTILRSKLQFLAVILITALAMTLYVGLTSNAKSIQDRVDILYSNSNIADIWTTTSSYDENDIVEINKLVGENGKTEERTVMPSLLQGYEATAILSDELPTINKPANTDNTETNDFFIIDERMLETHDNPASLVRWMDEEGNYLTIPVNFSIASYLQILTETKVKDVVPYLPYENTLFEVLSWCVQPGEKNILLDPYLSLDFKITGVMNFAENVQNSQMNNTSFLLSKDYFKRQVLDKFSTTFGMPQAPEAGDPNADLKNLMRLLMGSIDIKEALDPKIDELLKPNQYVSKVDPSLDAKQVRNSINDYFKTKENSNLMISLDLDNMPNNMTIQNDIVQARQLAYIFPIIFFLVAILVVLTTISQLILKDRIQIGTMKALGISTTSVVLHYVALSIYIVLIGIVVGIIAGPFIIPMIMNQKYDILYTLPGMSYTIALPEMLISTLVVLLLTSFVTYLVVRKESKLNPAEGMRPKEIKVAKTSKKDLKVTKNSIPIRMALRNIRLNLAKSLMVVLGVCGCTALLVCGFGIDDTLNFGVASDEKNFYKADVYATYNSNESKKDDLLALDGVEYVEEYTCLPTTITTSDNIYQTMVYAFDDNSHFFYLDDYELEDDIIVSNKVAKQLNLSVGDEIDFSSLGVNFKGKVGYILDCFYMHGIYINSSAHDYDKIAKLKTNAYINTVDGTDEQALINEITKIRGVSNSQTKEEGVELISSYMSSISLMTLAVKVFAILLAIVVLYNLSLLNFKERSRDVATLKVLGFSKYEISNSLFFESLILTLIGVGFGLLLGLPMEILVLVVNLTPLVEFLYTVFPMSYVISLVLTIGTAILVNGMLITKIDKVQMIESLKSVE